MYTKLPNLILGFHGCDQSVCDDVLKNGDSLCESSNTYDWLGNGIYFWENGIERAYDWARNNKKIKQPAVVGAVIDLGHCLNLTDYKSSEIIKAGYDLLKARMEIACLPMPINRNIKSNKDLLLRDLDCAVIQTIHEYNRSSKDEMDFDSVRGVFIEGGEIYESSGFREKTHIQVCVVNPNCIKGYFAPRELIKEFVNP